MADKSIVDLENQITAQLQDKLVIVDMDRLTTNNIAVGNLATSIFSANLPITASNLLVNGAIVANQFLVTTSSVNHFTASTSFGLDSGDTHAFTGSVMISGSLGVKGNTTLIGNTVLSGSLEISGSQTRYGVTRNIGEWQLTGSMFTSGSTTITGNTSIGGNLILSGSIQVSGSFTGSLDLDGDVNLKYPHNFYRWGNRLFNYANYYNTGSINLVSGSATTINYTSDVENGFTLVNGSQITATHTGYYNVQYSVQLQKPGAQSAEVDIWLSKNGQNISYTNSSFTLPFKSNLIAALNFFVPLNAGDYVELIATTNDSTVDAVTIPANGIKPAAPSVVVTVSQIS